MKNILQKASQANNYQQNQQNLAEGPQQRPSQPKLSNQGTKGIEKASQFLLTKSEKPKRGRPKLTQCERKDIYQNTETKEKGAKRKEAPSPVSVPENLHGIDSFRGKQYQGLNKQIQKSVAGKTPKTVKQKSDTTSKETESEKKSKREQKQSKKAQKQKDSSAPIKQEISQEMSSIKKSDCHEFPQEILEIFREKYPFYLIGTNIVFPIQDSLLEKYPDLGMKNGEKLTELPYDIMEPLPETFNKELQIWNMLVENASFFEIKEQLKVTDIHKLFGGKSMSLEGQRLWKGFARFYLSDILYHKYQESINEDYYSFISLWRYTDENAFLDRLFQTNWNKFILFYIRLVKPHYSNSEVLAELTTFQKKIEDDLNIGKFYLPQNYSQMLDYIVLLINMCFETHTFKSLINGKMLFFRDNNKIKNQLLEEKKNFENSIWELKQNDKNLVKRQKAAKKALKKQAKTVNNEKVAQYEKQIEEINDERATIMNRKLFYNQKIVQIDNKIYELCCLPEFSNVWLMGQDRFRNLYWFVREHDEQIYFEDHQTGQWKRIKGDNIDKFHQSLNNRGIRERKLFEKILYYSQLGYIKTCKKAESTVSMECEQNVLKDEENNKDGEVMAQEELIAEKQIERKTIQTHQFDQFVYGEYKFATPEIIKLMILKSEWLMTKYLYERNSRWIAEEIRQEYINYISSFDFVNNCDYEYLTKQLRLFNEKICVVEINIKVVNQNEAQEVRTRKIQTKIWGINEKYKHFWYDYSKRCKNLSDLHFLISVLYLTIERYVTKTRKPNNTKYFFKTVEFGEVPDLCEYCEAVGELQNCPDCEQLFHPECMNKHKNGCTRKIKEVEILMELGDPIPQSQ